MSWKDDLEKSTEQFQNIVWPAIRDVFDGDELVPVEAVTISEMHETLDRLAGVDFWVISDDGMRGVASRVQIGNDWSTFTIRKERKSGMETEFDKRLRALDNDYLYPVWTVQAYLTENEDLLSAAVCRTEDLIRWIENGREDEDYEVRRTYTNGISWFYTVKWSTFRDQIESVHRPWAETTGGKREEATLGDFV